MMNKSMTEYTVLIFGVLAIIAILGFLTAYPMMLLWNLCLVPAIPVIKEVGWLQMWGIIILFGILFKTFNTSSK